LRFGQAVESSKFNFPGSIPGLGTLIMRYQAKSYSCGAASIVNTLRCFGKKIAEHHIWPLANTNEHGTDENGIIAALSYLGYSTSIIASNTRKEAIWELDQALALFPVILSVQQDRHWVTVISKTCGRYVVIDPANTDRSIRENGVYIMNKNELLKYWLHPYGEPAKYYGIIVRGKIV